MTGIVNRFAVGPITGESGKSHVRLFGALPKGELGAGNKLMWGRVRSVSYTHLTLPTIYSV